MAEYMEDEKTPVMAIVEGLNLRSKTAEKIYDIKEGQAVLKSRVDTMEHNIKKGFDENRRQIEALDEKMDQVREAAVKMSSKVAIMWTAMGTMAGTIATLLAKYLGS